MDKQAWISAKIKKLMDDGTAKDPKQASAIAYSMYAEMMKKKKDIEEGGEKYFDTLSQSDVKYTTLSTTAGQACANCRWFKPAENWSDSARVDTCHLVNSYPDNILPTGWCDRHEAKPVPMQPGMTPMPVVIVDPDELSGDEMGSAELGEKRDISTQSRNDAADSDFVDPKSRSFPILKAADVMAAVHSWGRYKGDMTFDEFKRRLTVIAKRKGFASSLPADWQPQKKSFDARLKEGLKALGLWNEPEELSLGFKVADNHWVSVWSNNFKDRDGEIFTAKAHDDYIARVDAGLVPLPELWVWHTPGSRIGVAEWVGRHGHFMLAGGVFDDTPEAQHAKAYYQKHAQALGVSHGYRYAAHDYDGKHYHAYNTVEISPLIGGKEANLFTALPIEGMKDVKELSQEKKQHLIAVLGQDRADRLLRNLEEGGKAYEELGVEYKDFAEMGENSEAQARKEALDNASKSFGEVVEALTEGQAEALSAALEAVKAVKAVKAENADLRKIIAKLQADADAKPRRASAVKETVVADDDPLLKQTRQHEEMTDGPLAGMFKS